MTFFYTFTQYQITYNYTEIILILIQLYRNNKLYNYTEIILLYTSVVLKMLAKIRLRLVFVFKHFD